VLRAGKPLASSIFDGDDLPTTMHFGVFENSNLQGVVSVFKKNSGIGLGKFEFQIRGMAVLENVQNRGFGKLLVNEVENQLKLNNNTLIWFNARTSAVLFYEKMGYQKFGSVFDIPDVGLHLLMFKEII
jgi:GNAT superfamily N-acetyltransferase